MMSASLCVCTQHNVCVSSVTTEPGSDMVLCDYANEESTWGQCDPNIGEEY